MQKKLFVISVGGSLINPGEIDTDYLKKFRRLVLDQTKKGHRFILVAGGGKICRTYNAALEKITKPTAEDLDWMGINLTWVNAKLLQLSFGKSAYPEISKEPIKPISFKQPILVGGGWKPGRSSDGSMVQFAKTYGAKIVINLSNIDYVYTKDPRKFKTAEKITSTSWKAFRKIVGNKWEPGANLPFDPIAAAFAQKNKLTVIIANGHNLKNLENILNSKSFIGTTIQ